MSKVTCGRIKCAQSKGKGFKCGGCGRNFCEHLCGGKHDWYGTLYATCGDCKINGKGWQHSEEN